MIAVVHARAGHARELPAAIEELAAAVRREPGCLTFVPYQDQGKELPDSLRAAEAESQVMVLASRLPGPGEFSLFRRQEGRQPRVVLPGRDTSITTTSAAVGSSRLARYAMAPWRRC